MSSLKYIAINDKLHIFSNSRAHDTAFKVFRRVSNGQKLNLQSAGAILVFHNREEGNKENPRRILFDSSVSLSDLLPVSESDEYKLVKINKVLGEFLEVT